MTLALSAVVLPDRHPVSQFLDDVRAAEEAGVGTVWTYDHLRWPLLADRPWYGAVPLLAAASPATERVRLGTEGPDARVLGESPRGRAERTDRFAEWLSLLDRLLTDPVTTVHGERYAAVEAAQLPGCVQRPRLPFTVAAAGARALRLAARYGSGWVTYGPFGADEVAVHWPRPDDGRGVPVDRLPGVLEAHGL